MTRKRPALVSIHDVMPGTLSEVGQLVALCRDHQVSRLTLLVVPGQPWRSADLDQLRLWTLEGCELAGHGWTHGCVTVRGWRHRCHSVLLSRRVAEHLCLTSAQIAALMSACSRWFSDEGLPVPQLYVPPAWALGPLTAADMRSTPFRYIETLTSVIDTQGRTSRGLPLTGFEADTTLRKLALTTVNSLMRRLPCSTRRPLRIAIHPNDASLQLSDDLRYTLDLPLRSMSYSELSLECPHRDARS